MDQDTAAPVEYPGFVRLTDGRHVRAESVYMAEATLDGVLLYVLTGDSIPSPRDTLERVMGQLVKHGKDGKAPTIPPGKQK